MNLYVNFKKLDVNSHKFIRNVNSNLVIHKKFKFKINNYFI